MVSVSTPKEISSASMTQHEIGILAHPYSTLVLRVTRKDANCPNSFASEGIRIF